MWVVLKDFYWATTWIGNFQLQADALKLEMEYIFSYSTEDNAMEPSVLVVYTPHFFVPTLISGQTGFTGFEALQKAAKRAWSESSMGWVYYANSR